MAKWKVVVECENCGRDFVRQGTGYNRQDADNQEAWAVEHPGICPDCWRRLQDEKRAAMWKGFPFCTLEGVSEKQISYADRVRKNWAENQVRNRPWEWGSFFKYYGQWLEGLDPDSVEKVLKSLTPEKLEALRQQEGVPRAVLERLETFRLALFEPSARKVLDHFA